MEETINEIVEFMRKKTRDFTNLDKDLLFRELASKCYELSMEALQNEYMIDTEDYEDE